jgi:glycosyltransferase involved in cell wall biosynthesis
MKILQLTEHYLPFLGGVEVNTHEICKRLIRDGFEVEVICGREKGTIKNEVIDGVKIHRIFNFGLIKLKYDVGRISPKMLLSALKNDADIVHAHAYGFFPTYASVFSNKPTLITTHSDPTAKIFAFGDLSRSIPLRLCDHVVATTELEKQHLIKRGVSSEKISLIPNGITLPPLNVPKIDYPSKTILCLARLDTAHKGQDILLQAMPKVISKVPGVKLWIAGDGKDEKILKDLTQRLKISKNVEFKGPITNPIKSQLLKNCSVLCIPPRTESFGVVYLEAMAYGRPIVTTRVGGIPEVVGDSALLVPPNDSSALANELVHVLCDDKLAEGLRKRSLERVKHFDWEHIVKKYEDLFERMK